MVIYIYVHFGTLYFWINKNIAMKTLKTAVPEVQILMYASMTFLLFSNLLVCAIN